MRHKITINYQSLEALISEKKNCILDKRRGLGIGVSVSSSLAISYSDPNM